MRKSIALRLGAIGTAVTLAGSLAVLASGTTGALFSESKGGGITGTIGAVHLETSNTTFVWTGMMPGEPKSDSVTFKNKGTGPQDFYLVFPNETALSSLNSLGEYGEAHISVNNVEKFASVNLNDGYPCGTPGINGAATLCAIPPKMLLASNVAVNETGSFTFTFRYAAKLGTKSHSSGGGVFNAYPAADHQNTVRPADGTGSGLPFQVVAVQVGQQP